jgi:hypothetical protein
MQKNSKVLVQLFHLQGVSTASVWTVCSDFLQISAVWKGEVTLQQGNLVDTFQPGDQS